MHKQNKTGKNTDDVITGRYTFVSIMKPDLTKYGCMTTPSRATAPNTITDKMFTLKHSASVRRVVRNDSKNSAIHLNVHSQNELVHKQECFFPCTLMIDECEKIFEYLVLIA